MTALSSRARIIWVDPPHAFWRAPGLRRGGIQWIEPSIGRISVPTLPFNTRFGVRKLVEAQRTGMVTRALQQLGMRPDIQVVSSPTQRFFSDLNATNFYFQTDDWEDGAELMGLSRTWITQNIRANSNQAHVVAAVTPTLLNDVMQATAPTDPLTVRGVLANGCHIPPVDPAAPRRERIAGVVGQLNERLDLSLLTGVIERGIPVRIVGPRRDRDPDFGKKLDVLLSAPSVNYVGAVEPRDIPRHLSRLGVGLTPYTDTAFNRSSFPLKTLEYLAAGLAVVSSDLPAVTWLETDLVSVGRTPEQFADAVEKALQNLDDTARDEERRRFAERHTWSVRASEFLDLARLPVG
ncbi:glycosyltransferase [Micrococcus terreus]|uniref:glycosyltransferase n=1 Tax=Micrococcus terreus TaxID=574650 RepID=UPI0033EFB47F